MSDYLARLVQRAQNSVPVDIVAIPAQGADLDAGLDDPFEAIGAPEPAAWPSSRPALSRPPAYSTPEPPSPLSVDRDTLDFRQPAPPAPPPQPDWPDPPLSALQSPESFEFAPPARPVAPEADTSTPPERLEQTAPVPPPQATADAFMEALVPKAFTEGPVPAAPPVSPPTALADNPPSPRITTQVQAIHDPHTWPEPAAHLTYSEPDAPVEPSPAPESRVSIGRLTVTVERAAPPPPERVVTRIVQAPPAAGLRAASARPRFGLAQS